MASRACGRPHECSGRSGMVLEPRGLEEAAGPGLWVVPWESWPPSHVGPENGEPARTPGAGGCSGPSLEALALRAWDRLGFTQVCSSALGLLATPGCESLRGCFRVIWEPVLDQLGD